RRSPRVRHYFRSPSAPRRTPHPPTPPLLPYTTLFRSNYPGLRVECFNDRLSSLLKESQQLVTDLPQAIEKGQMKIHVHPQHSLNSELIGVELLMRWQHPTLGNISPTRFIPLAEKENLIHSLGLWALEQAREFIRQNDYPGLNVSINVSP